jgi:hypothetical protein
MKDYADTFTVFAQYVNTSGNLTVVGGDSEGMVQTMDSGTTDNGTPIISECEFGPVILTDKARIKKLERIGTMVTHPQGLSLFMKVDDGNYGSIGTIDKAYKEFSGFPTKRGHTFYPKINAVNSNTPFQFDGFNFIEWGDEGYSD